MNALRQTESGYPQLFYKKRRNGWLILICIPLLVLGLFALGFVAVLGMGAGGILQVVGLAWIFWMISGLVKGEIKAWRNARIFPYYDKPLPGADTYLSGQALLRSEEHT